MRACGTMHGVIEPSMGIEPGTFLRLAARD
jgi:hypothetical protein